MKYSAIIFILLLLSFGQAAAQNKKTINKQLVLELTEIKQTYDSIQEAFNKLKDREVVLEKENDSLTRLFRTAQSDLRKKRAEFNKTGYQLKNWRFDPFTLVTTEELKVVDGITELDYFSNSPKITVVLTFRNVFVLEYIGDEKVKVQNPILLEKINEYKAANLENAARNREQNSMNRKMENENMLLYALIAQSRRADLVLDNGMKLFKTKIADFERIAAEEREKRLAEEAKKTKPKNSKAPKYIEPVSKEVPWSEDWERTVAGDEYSGELSKDIAPPPSEKPEKTVAPEIYEVYEEMPEFPGGRAALLKYLTDNLRYPQSAIDAGIEGKVYLKFVVSETGILSNVVVKRGIADCPECDKEAVRLVQNMPNWIPGKNSGKGIKCYYTLPLIFKLQ